MSAATAGAVRRLRVGIASLAHVHAATYARILATRADVDLVVADPDARDGTADADRGEQGAAGLGARYVPTYAHLLDEVDAVVVCTENAKHRPVVEAAARAGVHVLCEKPLATTVADARAMLDACRAAGVLLMTAYPVRFHPSFGVLRDVVRGGRLGRVLAIVGANNGQAPLDARPWFVDPDLAGGGAVMDHTVHLADLLGELLGAAPVRVHARANRIVHAESVEVETGGLVSLTYPDGAVAVIDCSWSAPRTFPTWGGLELTVEGELGRAAFDAFADRVEVYDDTAGGLTWDGVGPDLDALMLDEFVSAVRDGRSVQPDGDVGLVTLSIVRAAYASIETGRPVELTEDGGVRPTT